MDHKYFKDASVEQKCEFLKTEVEKVSDRIDKQVDERDAYKGVAFVLLPFILMVGYNALIIIFDSYGVIKEIKLTILGIILFVLFMTFRTFYKKVKRGKWLWIGMKF